MIMSPDSKNEKCFRQKLQRKSKRTFFLKQFCFLFWNRAVYGMWKNMVDSSWNVMAHGDAREGKWSGNWRMDWVASTLHTTSDHGVSSITTADAHTSAASSRLNWRPRRFKWIRPFRRKTKSGFCACAITFKLASTARQVRWQYGACALHAGYLRLQIHSGCVVRIALRLL